MATGFTNLSTVDLRTRASLQATDASRDTELDAVFGVALELVEQYLDRKLLKQQDQEHFVHDNGGTYSLHRYPVASIDNDNGLVNYHVDKAKGLVQLDGYNGNHDVTIDYTGGFDVLPGPLVMALLDAFEGVWRDTHSAPGAAAVGGTVKTVRMGDLSLTYAGEGGATGAGRGLSLAAYMSQGALGILDLYKRKFC